MSPRFFVLSALPLLAGCASAHYYDENGDELPGLPFVWKDAEGEPHLAYVGTSPGLGEATFTVERNESGGYTKYTNNLDSAGAARVTGDIIERAFEAGRRTAWAEMRARILELEDPETRDTLLRHLDQESP